MANLLTVLGDFVCPSDDPVAVAELLSNLRDEVLKLRPTPVLRHGTAVSRVPNNTMSTDYVSVRHDAHRGPLHRIYDGPYHVIERADKTFVLDIGGRLFRSIDSNVRTRIQFVRSFRQNHRDAAILREFVKLLKRRRIQVVRSFRQNRGCPLRVGQSS